MAPCAGSSSQQVCSPSSRVHPPGQAIVHSHGGSRPVRGAVGLGLPEAASRARPAAGGLAKVPRARRDTPPLDPERPLPGRPGRAAERRRHDPRPEPAAKGRARRPLRHQDLPGFVGANDAASGTAVVRELARTIKPRGLRPTLIIVFFDGEEAPPGKDAQFERYGLRGSKVAARAFRSAEAAIVLDFVGDRSSRSRATGSRTAGSGGGYGRRRGAPASRATSRSASKGPCSTTTCRSSGQACRRST